jgi:hypothetical protein
MPAPMQLDPELLRYCRTERQREVVKLVIELGGARAAARQLSCAINNVTQIIVAVKAHAALRGYSPDEDKEGRAPPGYVVKGKSTYYDSEGQVRGQWVKTREDGDKLAAIQAAAIDAACATIPSLALIKAPASTCADLLNVYTITDYHFNMLAWGRETGDDWDLEIADKVLRGAFAQMVDGSPPADTCVIAQLGDFSHTDGFRSVTPTSGHELDSDSRFEKAVKAMLEALRALIEYAATKHNRVIVLLAEGNHDMASSVWFRAAFGMTYRDNPRIEIIDSPLPYYCIEWGKTMLGWHHGHLAKNDSLPLVFAAGFPEQWGRTKNRFIHTGHRHHREVKEHAGAEVYQHPTLAARDAYAARGGWFAMRRAVALTYHREFGEWGSKTITPEMVL